MEAILKDKEKSDFPVQQYIDSFQGRPVIEKVLLSQDRLVDINDVIARASADNPKTLVVEFDLLLPSDGAEAQRASTMTDGGLINSFLEKMKLEVERSTPSVGKKIPNTLRFISRKRYMDEHVPYYSYRLCLLVNQDVFEDFGIDNQFGGLVDIVCSTWFSVAGLDCVGLLDIIGEREYPSLILDNFSPERGELYDTAHYGLSIYAALRGRSDCFDDDAFICSKE